MARGGGAVTTGKWSWILEIFLQLELTDFIRGLYAGVQNKEESGITSTFSAQDNERIRGAINENDKYSSEGRRWKNRSRN